MSAGRGAVAAGLGAPLLAGRPEAAVPRVRQAEEDGVPLVVAHGHLRPVVASA